MFFIINFIWCPKQLPSEDWPIFTTENSASQAGQYKLSFIKPFNPKTIPFCLWKVDCFLKYIIMRPNALKFGISEKHTKFEKNLPYSFYIYLFKDELLKHLLDLLNVQTLKKIFSNYVCFSESPNFMNFSRDISLWNLKISNSKKLYTQSLYEYHMDCGIRKKYYEFRFYIFKTM